MGCLNDAHSLFNTLGMNETVTCITRLFEFMYQDTVWDEGEKPPATDDEPPVTDDGSAAPNDRSSADTYATPSSRPTSAPTS